MAKMKSLTKILKNSGPRTEPCGTPDTISYHFLNVEPTLTRCFLCERQIEISARLFGLVLTQTRSQTLS